MDNWFQPYEVSEEFSLDAIAERIYKIFDLEQPCSKSISPPSMPYSVISKFDQLYGSVEIDHEISEAHTKVSRIKFSHDLLCERYGKNFEHGIFSQEITEIPSRLDSRQYPHAKFWKYDVKHIWQGMEMSGNKQHKEFHKCNQKLERWIFEIADDEYVPVCSTKYLEEQKIFLNKKIDVDSMYEFKSKTICEKAVIDLFSKPKLQL